MTYAPVPWVNLASEQSCLYRRVLHGGRLPGGPPVDPLPSDQLNQEARLMARYDEGSAPSDATEEEAEGEAHGWLIAR